MAYSRLRNGFEIQTASAIDRRIYLSKAEMLAAEDLFMLPDSYLCICSDDGRLYLYNVNNEPNAETGKYLCIEATLKFDTPEAKEAFEQAIEHSETFNDLSEKVGDKEERTGLSGDVVILQEDVAQLQDRINGGHAANA